MRKPRKNAIINQYMGETRVSADQVRFMMLLDQELEIDTTDERVPPPARMDELIKTGLVFCEPRVAVSGRVCYVYCLTVVGALALAFMGA